MCLWEDLCKVRCQKCKSKKLTRIFDVPNIIFPDPHGTSKMDSFSYRAGYNMEKAQNERRAAEAASHMGDSPYDTNDRDLNNDRNWGEVK